jgi:hypothetical protein
MPETFLIDFDRFACPPVPERVKLFHHIDAGLSASGSMQFIGGSGRLAKSQ